MKFDPNIIEAVEKSLRDLVWGTKGVRRIRPCTRRDLGSYKITFGYQRRRPLQHFLLIYDPEHNNLTLCEDGNARRPPQNVRDRLFNKIGTNGYRDDGNSCVWEDIGLDSFLNENYL